MKFASLTQEHDCWSYIRPAQRTTDSHMAFIQLKYHFLGPHNQDHMATVAECKLNTMTYQGEGCRWNFEYYVKAHVDQHHMLEGLKEQGYLGIDTRSKVQYLLDSIKMTAFEAVRAQILANPSLCSDFDACVSLFKDYIKQKDPGSNCRADRESTISAFKSNNDNRMDESGDADMSMEDRYYVKEEYAKLSAAKKAGLRLKRDNRGHQPGDHTERAAKKQKTGNGKPAPQQNLSKWAIMAIAKQIQAMNLNGAEGSESDLSEAREAPTVKTTNRFNGALQRKKN